MDKSDTFLGVLYVVTVITLWLGGDFPQWRNVWLLTSLTGLMFGSIFMIRLFRDREDAEEYLELFQDYTFAGGISLLTGGMVSLLTTDQPIPSVAVIYVGLIMFLVSVFFRAELFQLRKKK